MESRGVNWGVSVENEFGSKLLAGITIAASVGGHTTWDRTETRSISNTFETANTRAFEEREAYRFTIGNNNEQPGLYRFSLFGITDVYYVLTTTHQRVFVEEYFAVLARPNMRWGIDFDPDIDTGNFGKTGIGELLQTPSLVLSALPTPVEQLAEGAVPPRTPVDRPRATPRGSNHETSTTIELISTDGATIFYTLGVNQPPPDPTRASTRYTGSIFLERRNTATVYYLKAFAIKDGMDDSEIMTERYTISAIPVANEWNWEISRVVVQVDDGQSNRPGSHLARITMPSTLDIPRLRSEGYTHMEITVRYEARRIAAHYEHIILFSGHGSEIEINQVLFTPGGMNNLRTPIPEKVWGHRRFGGRDTAGTAWEDRPEYKIQVPLTSSVSDRQFNRLFTIQWGASGDWEDTYELRSRSITVRAIR
jgi:hypothetical protein